MVFEVRVNSLDGELCRVIVNSTGNVLAAKTAIDAVLKVPPAVQQLLMGTRVLYDDELLVEIPAMRMRRLRNKSSPILELTLIRQMTPQEEERNEVLRQIDEMEVEAAHCQLTISNKLYLETIPAELGRLTMLKAMRISSCRGLLFLPEQLGQLTSLQRLQVFRCQRLRSLPEEIGQLTKLQELHVIECQRLRSLPAQVGHLTRLHTLVLEHCGELEWLPEQMGQLMALETLGLNHCSSLESLPVEICQLPSLQQLDLRGCCRLRSLPWSWLSRLQGVIRGREGRRLVDMLVGRAE